MSSTIAPSYPEARRTPSWSTGEPSAARPIPVRSRKVDALSRPHPPIAQSALAEELATHPLFADSGSRTVESLCAEARAMQLRAGRVIYDEGQAVERVYVLMTGAVAIYHNLHERRLMTALLGAPCILGDRDALIRTCGYLANAMTLQASRLIALSAARFRAHARADAAGGHRLLLDVCARDAQAARRESSVFHPIATRLASLLLELLSLARRQTPQTVCVRATHEMLADALGVTSKSIARTLQHWGRAGLVTQQRGSLVVDPVRLEQLCPRRFDLFYSCPQP